MLKKLLKSTRVRFAVLFGIFHLLIYFILESSDRSVTMLQCKLDDYIPFCEYFIVPYVLWYVFVVLTICYFTLVCKNKKEFYQLMVSLCAGMVVFMIVSFVFPNGQELRPELTGSGVFIEAVRLLYTIDTSTNILPSLHVFEAVACCVAVLENEDCRKKKGLPAATVILTVLITLSTMFIKQHTVIDVVAALVLNGVLYLLVYKLPERHQKPFEEAFAKEQSI